MFAVLALAMVLAEPTAQPRLARDPDPARREAAAELQRQRRIRQTFARCIVGDYPGLAISIVNLPPSAAENGVRSLLTRSRGAVERCLSLAEGRSHFGEWIGSASVSGGTAVFVGAVAEQLYVKRHRQLPPVAPVSEPVPQPVEDLAVRATNAFANCVIDADALDVDRLVRSPADSEQERAAFAELSTRFSPCLDRGNSLILNPSTLRAALADQLYRRTSQAD